MILVSYYHGSEREVNDVKKIIGLLVMLPLFTISLTVAGQIETADAVNIGSQDTIGRPGYQPDKVCGDRLCNPNHGANIGSQDINGRHGYQPDKVCGDRLCSEPSAIFEAKILEEVKAELSGPYFDLVDIQKTSANSENMFNAIFDVWAGDEHIEDIKLRVTSDRETIETSAGSFNAGDHSIITVRIMATDPDSISSEIIDFKVHTGSENHLSSSVSAKKMNLVVGDSMIVEAKSLDGSYFELFDITSLGSGLYKVTLVMYAGPEEIVTGVPKGMSPGRVLHASSDNANELVYVPRINANSQDWLSVIISANEPSTIRIE